MPPDSPDISLARIAAPLNNLRLGIAARGIERREADAFRQAGRELANSLAAADDDRLQPFFASLARHQSRLDVLAAALTGSLERAHTDAAAVAPWVRPLVALRGLCDRALLHYQMQRYRREMGTCHEALGRAAHRISVTRAEEGTKTTAAYPSRAEWVSVVEHESKALGAAVWQQLQGKLVPRVSVLAGLAAGWWVASTYTDSHLRSIMRTVGIGGGGTRVVSGTMYKAMNFWLPILAAALCAYLGDRLARAIRDD